MSSISKEDMYSCIEEWFSGEFTLEGVCELYADLRLEIEKQKNFMLRQVAKSMREDEGEWPTLNPIGNAKPKKNCEVE